MNRQAHQWGGAAVGVPIAALVPLGDGMVATTGRVLLLAVSTYLASTPDWDLARYRTRRHYGAMLFRNIAKAMLVVQTQRDRDAWERKREWLERTDREVIDGDVHRLGTHTIEFCLGWAGALWWGLSELPQTAAFAPWLALTVAASLLSHLVLDVVTTSGIPVSVVFNLVVYRQAWRMHSLGWVPPEWGGAVCCDRPSLTLVENRPTVVRKRWYPLAKLRLPLPVPPDPHDRKRKDVRAGLLSVDDDVEHYLVVPVLRVATYLEALAYLGLLLPLWGAVSLW